MKTPQDIIDYAKKHKSEIADFDINDQEINDYILEINKIIKTNRQCDENDNNKKCGIDGFHFILTKDNQGNIFLKNYLCKKINNDEFLIKNNYWFANHDILENNQLIKKDTIWTDNQYKNRISLINTLISIKKEKLELKSLYLFGNTGSGKSFIMNAFCNEMALKNKSVINISLPTFILQINTSISRNTDFKNDIIEQMMEVDYLVIDDLGNEKYMDYIHNQILYPIISNRYKNNQPTFFVSNYSISDLSKIYKVKFNQKDLVNNFVQKISNTCANNVFDISINKRIN